MIKAITKEVFDMNQFLRFVHQSPMPSVALRTEFEDVIGAARCSTLAVRIEFFTRALTFHEASMIPQTIITNTIQMSTENTAGGTPLMKAELTNHWHC